MFRKICAAAIQFNISLGDVDANLIHILAALKRIRQHDARLAVLPEMWSTGYAYKQLAKLANETPRVLGALQAASAELDMVVVGSLPEKTNNVIYNTAYVIDKGELLASYRKMHLFSMMGEDRFLGAGNESLVVATSVGRIGVAICYDLRFPELFRKMALEGAEIICLPAEWPKPRQDHWRTLLRARAIENQLFVVAANCCGIQGKLDFFGMSLILSPLGKILAEGGDTETELRAILDFEEMSTYRFQIPCFKDRRPEVYGKLP